MLQQMFVRVKTNEKVSVYEGEKPQKAQANQPLKERKKNDS